MILKIVTGGQTGVDRAALDAAIKHSFPYGGWCPKGRLSEDGPIDEKYTLQETPLSAVEQRTEWNARDSDGTLILTVGEPQDGTVFTYECAEKYSKPYLVLDLEDEPDISKIMSWAAEHNLEVLNIAGPRESHRPGYIYSRSFQWLDMLLGAISSAK